VGLFIRAYRSKRKKRRSSLNDHSTARSIDRNKDGEASNVSTWNWPRIYDTQVGLIMVAYE
jgi:hypothetical protein